MYRIQIDDSHWQTTLPHIIEPLSEEWLPGLLLRCGQVNGWLSGTVIRMLLRKGGNRGIPNQIDMTVPSTINLVDLAKLLASTEEQIIATTYERELARLYHSANPLGMFLARKRRFHICPRCLQEFGTILRSAQWTALDVCPLHKIALQARCSCGRLLRPFGVRANPFTCDACSQAWMTLPSPMFPFDDSKNRLLEWYTFLLDNGTPEHLVSIQMEVLRRWETHPTSPYKPSRLAISAFLANHHRTIEYLCKFAVQVGMSVNDLPNVTHEVSGDVSVKDGKGEFQR